MDRTTKFRHSAEPNRTGEQWNSGTVEQVRRQRGAAKRQRLRVLILRSSCFARTAVGRSRFWRPERVWRLEFGVQGRKLGSPRAPRSFSSLWSGKSFRDRPCASLQAFLADAPSRRREARAVHAACRGTHCFGRLGMQRSRCGVRGAKCGAKESGVWRRKPSPASRP